MLHRRHFLSLLFLSGVPLYAEEAVTSSLALTDLAGSAQWPPALQKLLTYALSLTSRKLTYKFASEDPEEGGMDCSGTIYHTLRKAGFKNLPRSSDAIHDWVKSAGLLVPVSGTPDLSDPSLAKLKPGDLLFWTGTYDTGARKNPISHVMLYLGKTKAGKPVMFGASDGRPYQGKRQNGVSVFDFRMPKAEGKARFVGYGSIPGLELKGLAPVPPG
jgi:hypothetical protein